jgi:hypothetical protein
MSKICLRVISQTPVNREGKREERKEEEEWGRKG